MTTPTPSSTRDNLIKARALEWREDKPGRWLAEGYMILEELGLPPTLEQALLQTAVFSWKAEKWLFRDMRSEPTLAAAMKAAEAHHAISSQENQS